MKKKMLLLLALLLATTLLVQAQVTIGSAKKPIDGTLLMLDDGTKDGDANSNKGLGLPRVELKTLTPDTNKLAESIGADSGTTGTWDETEHIGLLVYNAAEEDVCEPNSIPTGLYIWNGSEWLAVGSGVNTNGVYEVTDPRDGEVYLARNFGNDAGDWMLENLRYNPLMDGRTDFRERNETNNSPYTDKYFYYAVGRDYTPAPANAPTPPADWDIYKKNGIFYNWAAATNNENISSINQSEGESGNPNPIPGNVQQVGVQGICPPNWHLPSDKEWNDLEKELSENPDRYTCDGAKTTWNETWRLQHGWRGGNHGANMKSRYSPQGNSSITGGKSRAAKVGGFDGILAGYTRGQGVGGYGDSSYLWGSSSLNGDYAVRRWLYNDKNDVDRSFENKYALFSVRCKKDN